MSRPNDPVELNGSQLLAFANALKIAAQTIDGSVQQMQIMSKETVAPKHWSSANKAAADISKFAGEVVAAVFASIPTEPAAKQPRKKKSKPKKTDRDQSNNG